MTKKKSEEPETEATATVIADASKETVLMQELEATKEELRTLFRKRRDQGFAGKRKHMAPESMQQRITKLSRKLRELKHSEDVARYGRFSGKSRHSRR